MTIEATTPIDFAADIAEWTAAMQAASDAAVVEVAAFGREKLKAALSGSSSSPGDPPATKTGKLVGSVTSITIPSLTGSGLAVWTGTTEFYGAFLNSGFYPNHSGRRRSSRERKAHQSAARGAGKVRRPYIDEVHTAALELAAGLAESIRIL